MSGERFDAATWRRISDLLDQGLELAPSRREHWLTEIAATEPPLAKTLRALLAKYEKVAANRFLESPALHCVDIIAPVSVSMTGKRAGAYTIGPLLGRGGMGEVWLASRSDGRFEGQCAIKFLDDSIAQPKLAERFRHEARLLARLAHPNIARLLDAGATDDGRQYLALEYVDGESIDRYCTWEGLGIEARVRVFLDVVSAVAHAHANLVIHRDLKPSNVFVTREGVVKLLDFGVAKLMRSETQDEATLTGLGETALTPEYAAPEQLLGEAPSTATDIYQLGLLLYVLLTGRHPLTVQGSRAERIKAALESRLPPASDCADARTRKALRGDLDAILATALRRIPQERYATAAALRDDLARYLNREPVAARRGAALYQVRKFVQRHRVTVFASSIALAGLCVALVFAFAEARVASTERDRAFALASRNQAITEFMGLVITQAAESDKPVTVADMLARSEELARADHSGNRENRAAILKVLAEFRQDFGDHGRATRLVEDALVMLGDSPDQDLRSELACGHAMLIANMGQIDAAARAMAHELAHPPPDPLSAADCLNDAAIIASVILDDTYGALQYATQTLERLRSSGRARRQTEAAFLQTLGSAYHLNGRHREAFEAFAQSLRIFTELGRERSPQALILRNNWAVSNEAAGMPKRALELYDESAKIMAATNPGRPQYLLPLNRGRALEQIGRYRESQASYELALDLTIQAEAKVAEAYCLLGLADTSRRLGDPDAAAKYVERAAQLLGAGDPATSIGLPKLAIVRGRLDLSLGKTRSALTEFTAALRGNRSRSTTIDARLGKAEAELLSEDAVTSAQDARQALQDATAQQGGLPYSRTSGLAWLLLGRASHALGHETQSREAFATAVTHLSNTVDADHPDLVEARRLLAAARQTLARLNPGD